LQEQVRESLIDAILSGIFPLDAPLPSCRALAAQLNVSRNTTALVFEGLVNEGYLISRPRSGYYLHPDYHTPQPATATRGPESPAPECIKNAPCWGERLKMQPSQQESILKPAGWMHYRYPFIYGQPDTHRFPLTTWRAAANWLHGGVRDPAWVVDHIDQDVPMLIEQIRTRVLPKRGIVAAPDEILITLGSQNALYPASRKWRAPGSISTPAWAARHVSCWVFTDGGVRSQKALACSLPAISVHSGSEVRSAAASVSQRRAESSW